MKISLDWLKDYVDVEVPFKTLAEKMTMIGLIVEEWEERDGDVVMDVETYANRPDTLGHLGMAREIAALLGKPLKERPWPLAELPVRTADLVDVQILDEDLCPRYCGLVVRGVKIGPSPEWLRKRVAAMGLHPVNNVVDVTNYVLFATGQPIHAFDLAKVAGPRILIRRAKKGERLRLLDGREAALTPDMLVIADEKKASAVAGVMGGVDSGISDATTDIFIESAVFDPGSIRRTRRTLEVLTDASYRFERGADVGVRPPGRPHGRLADVRVRRPGQPGDDRRLPAAAQAARADAARPPHGRPAGGRRPGRLHREDPDRPRLRSADALGRGLDGAGPLASGSTSSARPT